MNTKSYILIGVTVLIVAAIYFIGSAGVERGGSNDVITIDPRSASMSKEKKSKQYDLAKEITTPDGFINTNGESISIGGLVGKKIILVDFWTYSCINCQRTTPYLNAWYEKYRDKGLEIIGVHTPEFEFEKNYENVKQAVEKFGIKFPVVLDNDYSTWRAYKNQYWPRKYLIDIDGYVIYDHIGEGGYEETERKIQEALGERMSLLGESGTINETVTKDVSVKSVPKSPETYFGASRNEYFGNGKISSVGVQKNLLAPDRVSGNTLYLSGDWDISSEFAQNVSSEAGIIYKYNSKDVFFVAQADNEVVIEVTRDGAALSEDMGSDVIKTEEGKTVIKVKEARLYKIIEGTQSGTHTLELKIKNKGLQAFTFTFG